MPRCERLTYWPGSWDAMLCLRMGAVKPVPMRAGKRHALRGARPAAGWGEGVGGLCIV